MKMGMEITKDDFMAYEVVRLSGVTNMFNLKVVCELSDLTREQVLQIMGKYTALKKQYIPEA
jgi:hypothetical protein